MKLIQDLQSRAIALETQLSSGVAIKRIIEENDAYIIDMNVEEQLYEHGINRMGVNISDYAPYSPVTIEIKRIKGQPYDRVTLRDEGDFHSSFYIEADNQKFEIKASDDKTDFLIKKYGRQILGLTRENLAELIWEYILPDLRTLTKQMLYEH